METIARYLPTNQYLAAIAATTANAANRFATMSDIVTIYNSNGTVGANRQVTLTNGINWVASAAGGFAIGTAVFATTSTFHVRNATPRNSVIQGYDTNNNNSLLDLSNNTGQIGNQFRNQGTALFALLTGGVVSIGSTSLTAARLTVHGSGSTSATINQLWRNSSSALLMQLQDNGNLGIGIAPSTQRVLVRGSGNTNTTITQRWEDSAGAERMSVSDDGILVLTAQSNYITSDQSSGFRAAYNYTGAAGSTNHITTIDATVSGNPGAQTTTPIRGFFFGVNTNTGIGVQGRAAVDNAAMGAAALQGLITGNNWNKCTAVEGIAIMSGNGSSSTIAGDFTTTFNVSPTSIAYALRATSQRSSAGTGTFVAGYFQAINGANNHAIVTAGGNIGFGTTSPSPSALLELNSTTQGFLVMRMTAAQAIALTAVDGLMIYVTTIAAPFSSVGFWGRESGVWVKL
jgi:hypothetical protein